MDLKRVRKATISSKQCTACKHEEYVPALEDVPLALRDLTPAVLEALRPLDINTGRAGERFAGSVRETWFEKRVYVFDERARGDGTVSNVK